MNHNHVHWSGKHLDASSLVSYGSEDTHVTIYISQTSHPGYAKVGEQFEQAMVPVWHSVFSAEKCKDL